MEKAPVPKVKREIEHIDIAGMNEDEYLEKALAAIGTIEKTGPNKSLSKDSFIKVFKYTGDFAKLKS